MKNRSIIILATLIVTIITASTCVAQDDERRLWDTEFLKKRTAAKPASTTPAAPARKQVNYRRATPKPDKVDPKAEGEMVGVTVFRLRPSKATDDHDSRLLVPTDDPKQKVELTPERVEAETTFARGDKVRLSVESPRDGFLYVIDRERYSDGTVSNPYLIFPTLNIRGGDNKVVAGKVIEIPDKSTFTLSSKQEKYKGEILTLLITKEPLEGISVGPREVELDNKAVGQWEKQWGVPLERFEMVGGAGKAYTKAEKEAGHDGSRLLTQDDELPQTLYRVIAKPGNPVMITLPLRIR
ncbi:MAG TPA: hypothetical protein VFD58_26925 [Blastocatellia bacterium]|nr:hypothetical protein [Blastocatellia bacterium]